MTLFTLLVIVVDTAFTWRYRKVAYTEYTEKVKVIQNTVTAWNTSRATQSKEAKDVFDINLNW